MGKLYLTFENYKLFKQKELEIPADANVVIVQGDNETGKTSIITAIKEAYSLQRLTPEPLKQGEEEGKFSIDILDKNGEPIKIVYQFWADNSSKFYAIKNGKKINTIKEIKELIGSCIQYSIPEISSKLKIAETRRAVIDELIKPIVPAEVLNRMSYLEAKIKQAFDERREIGREKNSLENAISKMSVPEEDKLMLKQESNLLSELDGYNSMWKEFEAEEARIQEMSRNVQMLQSIVEQERVMAMSNNSMRENRLAKINSEIASLMARLEELKQEKATIEHELKQPVSSPKEGEYLAKKNELENAKKLLEFKSPTIENVRVHRNECLDKLQRINEIKIKLGSFEPLKKQYEEILNKYNTIDNELEKFRKEYSDIINSLSLPSGLRIDEGNITIDGLDFNETQLSESTMYLALVELLCKVNTSKLIVAGKYSDYNRERFMKLVEIAKRYNKQIYLENVVSGQEKSDVKCIINNDDPEMLGQNALNI